MGQISVKKWPLFDDRQHWKCISSTGHSRFFPADTEKELHNRVAEFLMDIDAHLGEPTERMYADAYVEEAKKVCDQGADFTVHDLPEDPECLVRDALKKCGERKIVAAHVALLDENGGLWKDGCGFTRETLLYALEIVKTKLMQQSAEEEE